MSIDWSRTAPVIVSILIIIAIAILRQYSRTLAAIVAVMPINIPLGMWIIYAGAEDKPAALTEFSEALAVNLLPAFIFIFVAWQMAKNGEQSLITIIVVSYIAWAIGMGAVFALRWLLGG